MAGPAGHGFVLRPRPWALLALGVVLVGPGGCAAALQRDPVRSQISMPAEPLKSLTIDFSAGVGTARVRSGCEEVVTGHVDYDAAHYEPEIIFTEKDGHGRLTLGGLQTERRGGDGAFAWDLCFSGELPLYIDADAGVGEMRLDLHDSQLRQLRVNAGVGEVDIILPVPDASRTRRVVDVAIDGGVGEVSIEIPKRAPVRVQAEAGTGTIDVKDLRTVGDRTWTTHSWSAHVEPRVEIAVSVGVGDVEIRAEDI